MFCLFDLNRQSTLSKNMLTTAFAVSDNGGYTGGIWNFKLYTTWKVNNPDTTGWVVSDDAYMITLIKEEQEGLVSQTISE